MQNVSRREYAGYARLQGFIHNGAVRHGAHPRSGTAPQLVLRQKSAGEEQRVTLVMLLRPRNRLPVLHPCKRDPADPLLSLNVHHRTAQLQRNSEILQTLHDVALESPGIGHQLGNAQDPGPLQCHAPCHDQTDIPGAEDDHPPSRQIPLHIDQSLGRARGVDAGRTRPRYVQRAPRPFPAAHGKDDRAGPDRQLPVLAIHGRNDAVSGDVQHHGIQPVRNSQRFHLIGIAGRIFRSRQLLLEGMQAKAVVNALVQDSPQLPVPFQNQDIPHAGLPRRQRRRHPRRAASDDCQLHRSHSLLLPTIHSDPAPAFVTRSMGIPSSLARSSMTLGPQKPPWHRPMPALVLRLTPSRLLAPGMR